MSVEHLEFLVEEPSMEAFLRTLLPRMLPNHLSFEVHPFQGKNDLLLNLPQRLHGYARWLPDTWRIIVILDQDDDDCRRLKQRMEIIATQAGLRTRRNAASGNWQLVNRLSIEELEAWYFGDWEAVCHAYPRVSRRVPQQKLYRNPDSINGGTWENFERILQRAGYFQGGLAKIEAARTLGQLIDPNQNRSRSFEVFRDVLYEVVSLR